MRVRLKQTEIDPDAWYDVKFLAARWRVHPITVFGWVRKQWFEPAVKIGPNTSRWQGRTILDHERALGSGDDERG